MTNIIIMFPQNLGKSVNFEVGPWTCENGQWHKLTSRKWVTTFGHGACAPESEIFIDIGEHVGPSIFYVLWVFGCLVPLAVCAHVIRQEWC